MKRLRKTFLCSVAIVLTAFFTACPNNPGETQVASPLTLSERLAQAKDGDIIDITAEKLTIDANHYTITKNLTIQNGDLEGVTFDVDKSASSTRSATETVISLTIKNVLNILFNVNESAELNMENSTSKRTRINGNGSKVNISGGTKITELAMNAEELSLAAEDSSSNFTIMSASEKVSKVDLAGSGKITTLLSAGDTEVTALLGSNVSIDSSDMNVTGASVKANFTEARIDDVCYCIEPTDTTPYIEERITPQNGVYSYTIKKSNHIWHDWMSVFMGIINPKAGDNYKIVFDVKTNVDAILPLKLRTNYTDGNERELITIADTWYPVTIYTGVCPDATERFILELPADNPNEDVTVSIRNIRFCAADKDDENAPKYASSAYYMMRGDGSVNVTHDGITTLEIKRDEETPWTLGGNLFATPLEYNDETFSGWNKITYKIKVKNATQTLCYSNSPRNQNGFYLNQSKDGSKDTYGSSWDFAQNIPLSENSEITVVSYLHVLKGHSTEPYDEKDLNNRPLTKIFISDMVKNTITITDCKVEKISTVPSSLTKMWHRELVNGQPNYSLDIVDENFFVEVPANGTHSGNMVLMPDVSNQWNPKISGNTVTGCINYVCWDGLPPEGISIIALEVRDPTNPEHEYIKIKNNTNAKIKVKVALTDAGLHFETVD